MDLIQSAALVTEHLLTFYVICTKGSNDTTDFHEITPVTDEFIPHIAIWMLSHDMEHQVSDP
jgi:hypothetical protein